MKKILAWMCIFSILLTGCGPTKEEAWQEQYDLGVRYLSEGNYEEAILAFTAAIEIDPKRSDPYLSLAEVYMEQGEYEKAAEILEQGVDSTEDEKLEDLENLLDQAKRMASIDFDHLVTDAFRETIADGYDASMEPSEWSVPQIMLDAPEITELNQEIWKTLYEGEIQNALDSSMDGTSVGLGNSYQWAVNGDILSLWIESHPVPWAWTEYYVYNVSISKGERLRDRDVYSAAGLSGNRYRERVRQAAGSKFWEFFDYNDRTNINGNDINFFNLQLQNTISEENVQQAKPFLNGEGHLCVAVPVYSMAGADFYWQEIDLDDFTLVPDYDLGLESAAKSGITEDEAYELVRDYWNFVPGTIAEGTDFELFLNSFGSVTGSNGRTYYEIRLQWLVDGDTEWGHLSTIDVMYVDAETGELTGDMLP